MLLNALPAILVVFPVAQPAAAPQKEQPVVAPSGVDGKTVVAPMPGMIIRYEVNEGDKVKAGDAVVILEAMKMQNTITAPIAGTVMAVNFGPGASVARDDVLAVIKP